MGPKDANKANTWQTYHRPLIKDSSKTVKNRHLTISQMFFLKTKYSIIRNIEVTTNFDTTIGVCATPKIQVAWMWQTQCFFPSDPHVLKYNWLPRFELVERVQGILPIPFSFIDMTPSKYFLCVILESIILPFLVLAEILYLIIFKKSVWKQSNWFFSNANGNNTCFTSVYYVKFHIVA